MSTEKNKKNKDFNHEVGDLVLVKWDDGMVYFAKIKRVDWRKRQCVVIFDDKSTDKAVFSQIHSVDETTTDIICIKCKKDNSEFPNEIVLCDGCGIGFHQKCHSPNIPPSAIEFDSPWKCIYCQKSLKNPYLTESIDAMQSLFSEESKEINHPQGTSRTHKLNEPVIVKEEAVSDNEDLTDEDLTTVLQPVVTSVFPRKRKIDRLETRKSQTKKRPLQVLRSKFARSRLGHSSTSYSHSRKRMNKLNEIAADKTSQNASSVIDSTTVSNSMLTSDENDSMSSTSENEIIKPNTDVSPPRSSRKRPRSLRVSLTLPPSVETTPVRNKITSIPAPTLQNVDSILAEKESDIIQKATLSNMETDKMELDTAPTDILPTYNDIEPDKDTVNMGTPVKDTPDIPVKGTPDTPVKDTPDTPVKDTPDIPVKDTPDIPVKDTPDTPVKDTPDIPVKDTPDTPVKDAPDIPVKVAPDTPVKVTPLTPVKIAPLTPVKVAPLTPDEVAPLMNTPDTPVKDTCTSLTPLGSTSKITITPVLQSSESTTNTPVSTTTQSTSTVVSNSDSLVKVSPGVTHLKPTKRNRPTSLNPLGTTGTVLKSKLSPLDRLRYEIVASNRSALTNSRNQKTVSTSLMPSTGTISSAPPIKSRTQNHHSRKSSVPSRAISTSPETSLHTNKTSVENCIVISSSPSPPPPPPPPPLSQHTEIIPSQIKPCDSNYMWHQARRQNLPRTDQQVWSSDTRPQDSMSAEYTNSIPSLKQIQQPSKEYVFHNHSARAIPVHGGSYDQRHQQPVHKDSLKSHQQVYPANMYLQHQVVPSQHKDVSVSRHVQTPYGGMQYSTGYGSLSNPSIRPQSNPIPQSLYANPIHGQAAYYTGGNHHGVAQYHNVILSNQRILSPNSMEQSADVYTTPAEAVQIPPSHTNVSVVQSPTGVVNHASVNQRGGIIYSSSPRIASTSYSLVDIANCTVANHPSICTTKPYAVVNAIPITQAPPLYNPPTTPNICHKSASNSGTTYNSEKGPQKREKSAQDIAQIREEATSDLTQRLHSFSNKYKDFDTLTPVDLMDIFHGALKKFQGNSKMYDSYPAKKLAVNTRSELVKTCATQTEQDVNKTAIVIVSEPSLPKYTACQEQLSRHYKHQVQTNGVFVPPSEAQIPELSAYNTSNQQQNKSSQYSSSHVQKSMYVPYPKSANDHVQSLVTTTTTHKTPIVEKRRRKPDAPANIHHIRAMFANNSKQNDFSVVENNTSKSDEAEGKRVCSSCGKHATFLCSGCHKLWYCGRECQVKSWEQHATSCRR